jgi:nitrile hydratase
VSDQTTADIQRRTAAVKAELLRKELLSEEDVQSFLHLADEWKPENGANVVARAWTDPEFRLRLLDDATAACAEMGYAGLQGEYIVALENTLDQHNVVVCTQCSCTAWPVLGLPPDWYKSPEYRARVVRQPRRVLSEMGLELSPDIGVRVWETSAETRYMVIPMRPSGSESMGVDELSALVTREALIGVALAAEVGRS